MRKTSVVIIGSGIGGITTAIYLKRANVDFILLEAKDLGGKLHMLHKIENYPGYSSISGEELVAHLKEQLDNFGIVVEKQCVQSILKNEEGFEVKTDIESIVAKAVVVASGIITKTDSIKGEKEFLGKGVSYCATCDGNFFKGVPVAVYGNNDIALEEAMYLSNLAEKVHLIVRESELKGNPKDIEVINKTPNISLYLGKEVSEIKGDMYGVTSVLLNDGNDIPVYGIFPYVGEKSALEFLTNLKPNSQNGYIFVDENKMSNIPGLFAVGDITFKKVRQLVTAASDGAIASSAIVNFLKESK